MPWCKIHSRLSETKDEELRTADFDYALPAGLIAQYPAEKRDASRLIVLHRATGLIEHRRFSDLPGYLSQGDILVLNDTRVFPARLTGKLSSGNDFEVLLLRASRERPLACPGSSRAQAQARQIVRGRQRQSESYCKRFRRGSRRANCKSRDSGWRRSSRTYRALRPRAASSIYQQAGHRI